ncbi:MAG: SLC13 family permease [Planctomycetes bacterium]|nr:SLC13 family permease [Planctomycetota bacterium]
MEDRWIALGIGALVLGLFLWNRLRLEVVGLLALVAVVLSGLVPLEVAVSGFANEALLTVAAMFVLSAALVRTGGADVLARLLGKLARGSELRLLAASLLLVMPLSAFVNNTPIVAVMIPVVLGLCREMGAAPSRLLMPISFASQLGGTLTLIGTSTNLLVAGLVVDLGLPALGLFDISLPAGALLLVGALYLLTIGRWLCPERRSAADLVQRYELRDYLATLVVPAGSALAGQTLRQLGFQQRFGLQVLRIDSARRRLHAPGPDAELHEGDRLLVEGKAADIARVQEEQGLSLLAEKDMRVVENGDAGESARWCELLVAPRCRWINRRLSEADLPARFGAMVLGVQRAGSAIQVQLPRVRLQAGDLLLVQIRPSDLPRIHASGDFAVLGTVDVPTDRRAKLGIALAVLVSVVASSALGGIPILLAALLGCLVLFLTGCLTPEEAYAEIDWSVLILIATMLPLGVAMQKSGAAAWITEQVLSVAAPYGPAAALAGLYLLASLLTAVISNNAAAVVLTPIAVATGQELGVSPMPFVVAVMLAASNSFLTPIGYQTNTFVFGPGNYRFGDFVRVGGPLNLLLVLAAALVIPRFFPF